jgi:hypothetical protein
VVAGYAAGTHGDADAVVLTGYAPDAGHNLTLHRNAQVSHEIVNNWLDKLAAG